MISNIGCFTHACQKCYRRPLNDKQRKTVDRDRKKKEVFQRDGIRLNIMTECSWNRLLPTISSTPTRMSRILLRDNEQSLLNAIREDSIFGFAVCSIETPQHLIDEFEKVRIQICAT